MLSVLVCMFFFFFKQKTAYEMRISDWSSDVCSSDLPRWYCQQIAPGNLLAAWEIYQPFPSDQAVTSGYSAEDGNKGESEQQAMHPLHPREIARSEEHTSELQSLMRISYAVFCLKQKIDNQTVTTTKHQLTHHKLRDE